jgi:hypothetical protein
MYIFSEKKDSRKFSSNYGESIPRGLEIDYAHLSSYMYMTYQRDLELCLNASLPFVDVHIVLTEEYNS